MASSLVRRFLTDYELVYVTFGRRFESDSQTPAVIYPLFLLLPEE